MSTGPTTSRTTSRLRPVRADYEPAYPRRLTGDEIRELLRPGLFRRFSPTTMLAGALVLAGLSGCEGEPATAGGAAAPSSQPLKSTRTDPQLKARVDQIVEEVLGPRRGRANWADSARVIPTNALLSNPPVKAPAIPISYGNSYVGVFDTDAAREATRRLFETYGIKVERGASVKGGGYEFVADGYDPRRRIGFKLIEPARRVRLADQQVVEGPAREVLAQGELPALDAAVKAGNVNIFVADALSFPNMDGDQFTPMQYYLASVVDYLNWVHGDRQIELNRVLGELPGGNRVRHWRNRRPPVPGGDFEADEDLRHWVVRGGKAEITDQWSSFGARSLSLLLEPGGEAIYRVGDGGAVELKDGPLVFSCQLRCEDPQANGTTVRFEFSAANGTSYRLKTKLGERWLEFEPDGPEGRVPDGQPPGLDNVAAIKVTADSPRPIRLLIDDIAVVPPRSE